MIRITALMLSLLTFAAHAAEIGETVRARIALGDRQLPLPRGNWIVAGLGTQELAHVDGPFGVMRSAVLIQRQGDRVAAIAEFNTNEIALSEGWDTIAACEHGKPELRRTRYRSKLDSACMFVTETPTTGGPPAWQQALDFIASRDLSLPDSMLTAAFIVSDAQDLVDARFHFDPTRLPIRDEAQQILFAWSAHFASEIDKGLANQLTDQAMDGPLRASLFSNTPMLDQKLLELETLQNSGAISPTDAVLQTQAAQANQPRSAAPPASDSWYDRVSTPVINFVTAYSVTQSGPLAVAIAVTEQVAHSALYAANQAGWDRAVAKATRHSLPVPALVHIGETPRQSGPTS